MTRSFLKWAALSAVLLAPATYGQVSCSREGLQKAVDMYLAAQAKGDMSSLPTPATLAYLENMKIVDIKTGVVNNPMQIDHHRSLLDTASCQTFTEIIVKNPAHPYAIGTRLRVNHDKIVELETIVTETGDWLFNADNYYNYASSEDWGTIPAAQRDTRATLVAAANAYLDAFLEGKMDLVPWGFPCNRTEGGAHTGKGLETDTCQDGVPMGVNIVARRFIVDETIGAVQAFCTFGVNGAPDSHLFRVQNGKLRFAHTLTHLKMADFQGRNNAKGKGAPGGRGGAKGKQ